MEKINPLLSAYAILLNEARQDRKSESVYHVLADCTRLLHELYRPASAHTMPTTRCMMRVVHLTAGGALVRHGTWIPRVCDMMPGLPDDISYADYREFAVGHLLGESDFFSRVIWENSLASRNGFDYFENLGPVRKA